MRGFYVYGLSMPCMIQYPSNSAVEFLAVNRDAAGSIPALGANSMPC